MFPLRVLYVGQSFGKTGNRTAFDRLSSHSTFQKILTELPEKHPNQHLYVYLLEITERLMMSFVPPRKDDAEKDKLDREHLRSVICDLPRENQVVNIAEAAIINYFKPEYNVNFVENFPDKNHKGYKQYFDLDYNALTLEIYPDFEGELAPIKLYSDTAELASPWQFIRYNLFNDNNRANMYEIFREKEGNNIIL